LYASNNKYIFTYFGSDTFLIITFEEEGLEKYSEKILNALRNAMIIEDTQINLTASMGIYINTKGEDVYTTFQNGDIALNYAKKQGGDCFSIFASSMKEAIFRKKVCMQIKIWKLSGVDYINVAVNVSAKQFRDAYLAEYIENILKENELVSSVLELEVTESAII